jgi:hypothetical protein
MSRSVLGEDQGNPSSCLGNIVKVRRRGWWWWWWHTPRIRDLKYSGRIGVTFDVKHEAIAEPQRFRLNRGEFIFPNGLSVSQLKVDGDFMLSIQEKGGLLQCDGDEVCIVTGVSWGLCTYYDAKRHMNLNEYRFIYKVQVTKFTRARSVITSVMEDYYGC